MIREEGSGIGDALLNAGDKPNALAAYEQGVAIARELVKQPHNDAMVTVAIRGDGHEPFDVQWPAPGRSRWPRW